MLNNPSNIPTSKFLECFFLHFPSWLHLGAGRILVPGPAVEPSAPLAAEARSFRRPDGQGSPSPSIPSVTPAPTLLSRPCHHRSSLLFSSNLASSLCLTLYYSNFNNSSTALGPTPPFLPSFLPSSLPVHPPFSLHTSQTPRPIVTATNSLPASHSPLSLRTPLVKFRRWITQLFATLLVLRLTFVAGEKCTSIPTDLT